MNKFSVASYMCIMNFLVGTVLFSLVGLICCQTNSQITCTRNHASESIIQLLGGCGLDSEEKFSDIVRNNIIMHFCNYYSSYMQCGNIERHDQSFSFVRISMWTRL